MNTVTTSNVNFTKLARDLLAADSTDRLARRYLDCLRRQRVLRDAIPEGRSFSRKENILSEIAFRAPLSVAGCDGATLVHAEHLAKLGVPIALEMDARGQHRGMSIERVIRRLYRAGIDADTHRVLDEYKSYMAACPALLSDHPVAKYAKIPRLTNQLIILRRDLEQKMVEPKSNLPRFTVLVESRELEGVLDDVAKGDTVTLGSTGKILTLNGQHGFPVRWGERRGIATVRIQDLRYIIDQAHGKPVVLQFGIDSHWMAWVPADDATVTKPTGPAWQFTYEEGHDDA